jgi:hypothetical protein
MVTTRFVAYSLAFSVGLVLFRDLPKSLGAEPGVQKSSQGLGLILQLRPGFSFAQKFLEDEILRDTGSELLFDSTLIPSERVYAVEIKTLLKRKDLLVSSPFSPILVSLPEKTLCPPF